MTRYHNDNDYNDDNNNKNNNNNNNNDNNDNSEMACYIWRNIVLFYIMVLIIYRWLDIA